MDELIKELSSAESVLAARVEGYRDFSRLNLSEPAQLEVQSAFTFTQRRVDLLHKAVDALSALKADGYPTLPKIIVTTDVIKDLIANYEGLKAALAEFQTVEGKVTFGEPVKK